ncbi:MAG TPA: enoyl-CoA hydratase [Halieaceae bacterium]|uniref:crotonase/enoyl-CoA hydratase family protein n=1 Tax=Haliea sp. TaxID=1932666 RepID=UPI000C4FEF29|nr:crotonase/enoyl-CoA hydratase family protein [Haliea sp.]HAN69350.1 enoyl-CoA hydratase [Halieaceae bacterium]MAD65751.1 enoyl-CoA hydratase [Haliea sp.]MAY91907.1 enoyl-CoA hydratase [Haliea sp.]MBK41831.1 enoyl-CoA hydratase [Haliea sp.]MBP70304.1 enoyl-CoA hydratase [Haliea sp.]
MNTEVLVEQHGAVLVVSINRPRRRNAVTRQVSEGIAAAMDQLDEDEELSVGIITGTGGNFCAGMDLQAFLDGERPEIEGRGFGGISERPPQKPLIAAVEGFALAGGCELALACDLIVAAEDAFFGLPEVSRGLVAGSGGLVRLPRRIPPAIALEYALTGARLPALEAHSWGLVNRVTASGGALAGALALATSICANGPLAVAMTKRIVMESPNWPQAELWSRQAPLVDAVLASEDAREGALAFAEKRPPIWRGR